MGQSQLTTDHATIQRWAEERHARPARVKGTGDEDDAGLLRIDFPETEDESSLEEISWEEFFAKFDEKELAFIYQERTADGKPSNFNKLVSR